jgi:hypothetical protein
MLSLEIDATVRPRSNDTSELAGSTANTTNSWTSSTDQAADSTFPRSMLQIRVPDGAVLLSNNFEPSFDRFHLYWTNVRPGQSL